MIAQMSASAQVVERVKIEMQLVSVASCNFYVEVLSGSSSGA